MDWEALERYIRTGQENAQEEEREVVEAPDPEPCQRLWSSRRSRRFAEHVSDITRLEAHHHNNGPMTASDRFLTGMFDDRNQGNYGDKVIADLMRVLNEYHDGKNPISLRHDQKPIVSYVIVSLLPFIYGINLEANKERVLKLLNAKEIRELVLIVASRRVGKSFCISIVFASLVIVLPVIEGAVISVAERASKRIMDQVKLFLNMHPEGRKLMGGEYGKGNMRMNTAELQLVGAHPSHVKKLNAYPMSEVMGSATSVVEAYQEVFQAAESTSLAEFPREVLHSAGTLNIDWTNRSDGAVGVEELAGAIQRSVVDVQMPERLTLTEVSNKNAIRMFERCTGYVGVLDRHAPSYGYMYTGWRPDVHELVSNFVTPGGRYNGILLRNIATGERILHVSAHLPLKKQKGRVSREECARNIHKLIVECREKGDGVDTVTIAGDFNDTPDFLARSFGDLSLSPVIDSGSSITTTTKRGKIVRDNIVVETDRLPTAKLHILDKNASPFSHLPLSAFSSYVP